MVTFNESETWPLGFSIIAEHYGVPDAQECVECSSLLDKGQIDFCTDCDDKINTPHLVGE